MSLLLSSLNDSDLVMIGTRPAMGSQYVHDVPSELYGMLTSLQFSIQVMDV